MTTANIMLYVEDVEANADFWKHYLNFKEVERYDFGDSISIVLAVSSTCNLQLFNIDFIRKNSPEVASNKPSLLFDTSDFDGNFFPAVYLGFACFTSNNPLESILGIHFCCTTRWIWIVR